MNLFRFFSNFWKPRLSEKFWVVYAERSDRLSRNFLGVMRNLFAEKYQNFVTSFFQNKKKFSKIFKQFVHAKKRYLNN